MQADKIREEQIEAGRRQSRSDNGSQTSYKPKTKSIVPKGHEAFLKALEASSATVSFEKISTGDIVRGLVKHSDKFTVSVDVGGGKTRVLFKHDISEFSPESSRAEA